MRPYRIPHAHAIEAEQEIQTMLKAGIIEPSNSPWCAPVLPIRKKDGTLRICVDYRKLNQVTVKDTYPLPRIDDILDAVYGSVVYTTLDALSGYWQIPVEERDQPKTAFAMLGKGLYQFKVMPFGLCNAPGTFQRCMENMFRDMSFVMVYIDDILIFSSSMSLHLVHLRAVFDRLRQMRLRCKRVKCFFAKDRTEYLGFVLGAGGLAPQPQKLDAIRDAPVPRSRAEVQSFLGLASYYRRFVPKFALIARPLNWLLRKGQTWTWEEEQENAYQALKTALITAPVLAFPNFEQEFIVTTDGSLQGIAVILSQLDENQQEHPVNYGSRSLAPAERNYSPTHLEGLAIIWAITHYRHYLIGRHFTLRTDHSSLVQLFNSATPLTGRLARWSMLLREYDFSIEHIRGHINPADFPSRNVITGSDLDADFDDILVLENSLGGMDYAVYLAIKYYLTDFSYPQDATEEDRRRLRNRSRGYYIKDGDLCRRRGGHETKVLHERNAAEAVKQVHEEFHFGVDNTFINVQALYSGPHLFELTQAIVASCTVCQQHNPYTAAARAEPLHPIEATRPLAIIGLDIVGPINPQAEDGARFILTAIDYHTRWPIALATKDATTGTLVSFLLNEVIAHYGVPSQIITDRGSVFTDQLTSLLFEKLGIRHTPTTAYRPQANGRVERMHRTMKMLLAKMTREDRTTWPSQIWKALLAMRTLVNEATRFSPARLLYGFELTTPTQWKPALDRNLDEPNEVTLKAQVEAMDVSLEQLREQATINSTRDQARQRIRYDILVRPRTFAAGDLVLLRIDAPTAMTQTAKFSQTFEGPYTVVRPLVNGAYLIQDDNGAKDSVHVDRLRPFTAHTYMVPELLSAARPLRSTLRRYRLN
jgi:transposase InsO family protein